MSTDTTSPESARQSTRRYASNPKNKKRLRAKWAIQSAVRSGKLKKPKACPRCGRSGVRIIFHHTDGSYGKGSRMRGKWLCDKCHNGVDPKRHGAAMSNSMKHAKSNK